MASSSGGQSEDRSPTEAYEKFKFVDNDGRKSLQIRSHVMRESWRQRKAQNLQQTGPGGNGRALVPKKKQSSQVTGNNDAATKSGGPTAQAINATVRHVKKQRAKVPPMKPKEVGKKSVPDIENEVEEISRNMDMVPTSSITPWSGLEKTMLMDSLGNSPVPFQVQHQQLIHYWVEDFPKVLFGAKVNPTQNGHISLWVPLDLSNESSYYAALASSTIMNGNGEPTNKSRSYNQKALQILNQWIQDPVMSTSDAAISAILRQTALETYWGSEEILRQHLKGLMKVIEVRGGLETLHSDWRLEAIVHNVLLNVKPYWARVAHGRPLAIVVDDPTAIVPSVGMPKMWNFCAKFVQFFLDVKQASSMNPNWFSLGNRYPTVVIAVELLRDFSRLPNKIAEAPHHYIEETTRLICSFYIAITALDSLRTPGSTHMEELELLLKETKLSWANTLESLLTYLLSGNGVALKHPARSRAVLGLMEVARPLCLDSWTKVKNSIIELLLAHPVDVVPDIPWDAQVLFTEIRDR